ncbi:MAG: hypothetical protein EOM20_06030 [Spartobacteria bacterium]|nr:hypothetical protein [Spartobacteria bacterium]
MKAEKRHFKVALIGLFAIAWVARLLYLGRAELWEDEMNFVNLVADPSKSTLQVFKDYWMWVLSIAQLPLPGVMQNAYMHLVGVGVDGIIHAPFYLRLPASLLGAFTVVLMYKLAELFFEDRASRWAAALMMGFTFYPVYYSREVYCYAHIMFFSTASLWLLFSLLLDRVQGRRWYILLTLSLAGLLLSHFAGLMLALPMGLVTFLYWGDKALWHRSKRDANRSLLLLVCFVIAGALFSPYFLRFVLYNQAHTGGSEFGYFTIVNDGLSKMLLGEAWWFAALAWIIFLTGGYFAVRRFRANWLPAALLVMTVISLLLLAWATHRSQYLSARYLSPALPGVLLIYVFGFKQAGTWLTAPPLFSSVRKHAVWCVAAPVLAIHVGLYLPVLYRLTHKAPDFGSIAAWLNEHLEPQTPYLMESAYQLRYVSNYFPTPDLVPAAPYTHGPGPQEMQQLCQYQKEFMLDFPEAPFIQSAHHGAYTGSGIWSWPSEFYAHEHMIRNEPLRSAMRLGIFPATPYYVIDETSFTTLIYYNEPSDLPSIYRKMGCPVTPVYNAWGVAPIGRGDHGQIFYARVVNTGTGSIELIHDGNEPITCSLKMLVGVMGPLQALDVVFKLNNRIVTTVRQQTGSLWPVHLPGQTLQPGVNTLTWGAAPTQQQRVQALLLKRLNIEQER